MNMVMLDCDHATLLATKKDMVKLGCIKKMQLRMHLMGCRYCREYVRQSEIINDEINIVKQIDPENLSVRLTDEQKTRLNETIEHYVH